MITNYETLQEAIGRITDLATNGYESFKLYRQDGRWFVKAVIPIKQDA